MKNENIRKFTHLFAGVVILLQGFNWFKQGISLSLSIYLFLACIFLLVAGLHKWVNKQFTGGDAAFLLIEAATFMYAAVNLREDGSKVIWILFGLLGMVYIGFAIAAIVSSIDRSMQRGRRRRGRRRRTSVKA